MVCADLFMVRIINCSWCFWFFLTEIWNFLCAQRFARLPVSFRSLVVKLSINDPLNLIAYSNGPFFSWLHVPLMGHFFNASLMWDRVTLICDISFLPEAPRQSLSLLIQPFHFPTLLCWLFWPKPPPVSTQAHGIYCSSYPGDRYSRTFLLSLASCWNLSRQSISTHTNKLHGRRGRWPSRAIVNLQVNVLILSFTHSHSHNILLHSVKTEESLFWIYIWCVIGHRASVFTGSKLGNRFQTLNPKK